ncbi:MAG: histone deacetylase [Anaerolineae bacterium]|nr:histone deacetylase [Anaerolineae bacterium]MDW8069847.1 histone deacetylase [Anaerolineae bacterium]
MNTGYVYDEIFLRHTMPGHPENHHRLEAIMQQLASTGVLERLAHIPARPATRAELERAHRPRYIETVRQMAERGGGYLDPDTYVTPDTFEVAVIAAGSTIEATSAVLNGIVRNAFALVRPPGHHALAEHGMGFCIFGNVALAALTARQVYGLERVVIVDFDVHHGNGTQALVAADPGICYISTHQFPHYPGSGAMHEIGSGVTRGNWINIPLAAGAGDRAFQLLYAGVVIPATRRFKPDLILVSAGYDAHHSDPLADLALSLAGYAWLARTLVALAEELCHGRIVFVLEGGYNLQVLAYGVLNTFYALLGDTTVVDPLGPSPRPERDIREYVAELRRLHHLDNQVQ